MRAADFPFFDVPFIAMAHRGGAAIKANRGRENTIHAFRTAVRYGYRYLETDVHATADGRLIAFHDDRLERVTDRSGVVANLPWSEVSRARISGRDPIPLLSEALEEFPDVRFNIDIKADQAIDPLVEVINRQQAWERVCVASFSQKRVQRFRKRMGRPVALGTGMSGVATLRFIPVGSRWVSPVIGCALQLPISHRVLGMTLPIVTPALIRRAHKVGAKVHVWTVDDAAAMNRLIDMGVDGLIADRIDVLAAVLKARRLWF